MSDAIIDILTLRLLAQQHPTAALRTYAKHTYESQRSHAAMRCPGCALHLYDSYPPYMEELSFQFENGAVGWCYDCRVRLTPMEVLCPAHPSTT